MQKKIDAHFSSPSFQGNKYFQKNNNANLPRQCTEDRAKNTLRMKGKPDLEKIFAIHIFDKGHTYKESL